MPRCRPFSLLQRYKKNMIYKKENKIILSTTLKKQLFYPITNSLMTKYYIFSIFRHYPFKKFSANNILLLKHLHYWKNIYITLRKNFLMTKYCIFSIFRHYKNTTNMIARKNYLDTLVLLRDQHLIIQLMTKKH